MTSDQIERLRMLSKMASPRPWRQRVDGSSPTNVIDMSDEVGIEPDQVLYIVSTDHGMPTNGCVVDATLIAEVINCLPELLDAAERGIHEECD